jgi:hypothetical protein
MRFLFYFFIVLHFQIVVAQTPRITGKGLTLDTAYFVIKDKMVGSNEFSTGTHVAFMLRGLKGLSILDGKSFPGITMKIINSKNVALLDYADLFEEYTTTGVGSDDARSLSMTLTVGSPLTEGEIYTWYGRVWDKNGKAELIIEMPIKVVKVIDQLGIKTINKGLSFANAYIMDSLPLQSAQVTTGTKLTFVFSGVAGYTADKNNLVNIGMHVRLQDDLGVNVMEYTDLFRDYGPVDATKATTLSTYLTIGDPILPGKNYTWWVRVWDKGTSKSFESTVLLQVK